MTAAREGARVSRTVAAKMGLHGGCRAHLHNAPAAARAVMQLPDLHESKQLRGVFDYLHLFSTRRRDLEADLPRMTCHLSTGGALWVSWPKSRQLGTNLTLPTVIEVSYQHNLVESTCLSIDPTWSALKLTRPIPGKTYANSYGTLPSW